jgi:hypothetical protein
MTTTKTKKPKANRQGNNFFKGRNKVFNGKKLGEDLYNRRVKLGVGYVEVQKQTGIAPSVLYRTESGENISINVLASVCNWLNVPVQNYFK